MQNYDYKHAFLWIFNFYTFLSSFHSCFLHIVQPGPCPLLSPQPYPYLQAKTDRELCGENQRRMNTGI